MPTRSGKIELNQDPGFQRREWLVQRVGWWILTAFVASALLGVFGSGPLSRARAGTPGAAVWIEYERFVRVGAPSRMYVHLGGPAADGHTREVRLDRRYWDGVRVDQLLPEPQRVVIGADEVSFLFDMQETPDGSTIILDLEPLKVGRQSVRIGTGRQPALTFAQFAYF